MKWVLSLVLPVVVAVGCGSGEGGGGGHAGAPAEGGAAEGGAADGGAARTASGAGGAEPDGAGGQAAESIGGETVAAGGATASAGAGDSGGATQAGAGGFDSAGAPAAPDPCDGKTCNGHGACVAGVCSCETGYAAASDCASCSGGYTGYPSCVMYPLCKTYENFFDGSVCRGCSDEDLTICASDGVGHDVCFCAKPCPSNTCPSLQTVPGQCRSGSTDLCFLSCEVANGGTSTGCPAGFTCRVIGGGGDATCIQD